MDQQAKAGKAPRALGERRPQAGEVSLQLRPRRRRKHERPEEILAAALEEFAEKGYAATRLDEVARRAGVTKGTIYLYYASKDELFQALVRRAVVPQFDEIEGLALANP